MSSARLSTPKELPVISTNMITTHLLEEVSNSILILADQQSLWAIFIS